MDLLSVFRTFRRHWLRAMPILLLTFIGLGWAMLMRTPDYEAEARLAVVPQAAVPRTANGEIIAETERGRTLSPLSRFNDLAIVVDLITNSVSVGDYRQALAEKGANPDYEVSIDPNTAVAVFLAKGKTAEDATNTLQLVFDAFKDELHRIQADDGVDPDYMITTMPIQEPGEAIAKPSSSVRVALAIGALGVITAFVVVSIAEARRQAKEQRQALESAEVRVEMHRPGDVRSGAEPSRGEDLTRS